MLGNLGSRDCDRFIPPRHHDKSLHPDCALTDSASTPDSLYSCMIKRQLFGESNERVMPFPQLRRKESSSVSWESGCRAEQVDANACSPTKILDIPGYRDDYYQNCVDWSSDGTLAIALDREVYLYNAEQVVKLCEGTQGGPYISSVKLYDGIALVGMSSGDVEVYDLGEGQKIRTVRGHQERVAALDMVGGLLVTGSKDKCILVHDLREEWSQVRDFGNHNGEICTIKAKNGIENVFASGSTDGTAIVWDLNHGLVTHLKGHKGAVKALDWCPWKNGILATGGGNSSHKNIKVWNTNSSMLLANHPIDSQISGIAFNDEYRMMVTAHGHPHNTIELWSLESSQERMRVCHKRTLPGHRGRILNLLQSHDQKHLCTAGADENLRVWALSGGA